MELSQKTTILFSRELHRRLMALAAHRGVSMGQLVREACEIQYGVPDTEARREIVQALAELSLPVEEPREMKEESVPSPKDLLP